jgi:hypothetical protein
MNKWDNLIFVDVFLIYLVLEVIDIFLNKKMKLIYNKIRDGVKSGGIMVKDVKNKDIYLFNEFI